MTDQQPKPKRVQSKTKTTNASFYLGTPPNKTRRLEALKAIAEANNTNLNGLLTMIADGILEVVPAKKTH